MSANGYPLALAVLCFAAGVFCWKHRWGARAISLCAALTSVFAIAGIPAWRDALAGVFGTGPGMVILVIITFGGVGSYVIDHLRHHHPVRSSALGIIGATAGTLAWAMAPELGKQGSKLGPKTAAAMGQAMHQIRNGHAASAQTSSTRATILFIAVLAIIVLVAIMHRDHKRRPFKNARKFGYAAISPNAPRELTAGPSGGGKGNAKQPSFVGRLTSGKGR